MRDATDTTPALEESRRWRWFAWTIGVALVLAVGAMVVGMAGGWGPMHSRATTHSSSARPSTKGAVATTLRAHLGEMYIRTDHATVRAGDVRITASNDGAVLHEMVIVRTTHPAAGMPTDAAGKASETGSAGEFADLPVGKTLTKTFHLAAGHYALVCNLPGHYGGGMRVDLTVTQ